MKDRVPSKTTSLSHFGKVYLFEPYQKTYGLGTPSKPTGNVRVTKVGEMGHGHGRTIGDEGKPVRVY